MEQFANFYTNRKPTAVLNDTSNTDEQHVSQQSASSAKLQKVFEKDGNRAIVVRDDNGNWVLNAYNITRKKTDKKRSEADATRLYQSIFENGDGNLVLQNSATDDKVSETSETAQGNGGNNTEADAMPMVKVNGKMRPDYMAAPVERTRRHIYEEKGLSREEGDAFVQANIDAASKELEKREKKAPVMGTDIDDYLEKKQAWQAEMDGLQRRKEYWESVKKEQDKTTGMNFFAGQDKVSAEMQEAQKDLAGDTAAMELLSDTAPQTLEELASVMLSQGKKGVKLMLNDETEDGKIVKGVSSHTGYARADLEKMPFLFATRAKGGMSPEEFAHELLTAAREEGIPFDESDANAGLTAVLNLLGDVRSQSDINNYIQSHRIAEARNIHEANLRQEAEWQEQQRLAKEAAERLGMNEEEWDAYISSIEAELAAQDAYYASDDYRNNITQTDTNDNGTTGTGPAAERAGVEGTQGQADRPDGPAAQNGTEEGKEIQADDRRGSDGSSAGREQSGLAQAEEVDENGHPFIKSSDGTINFGYIGEDSGLQPAPIRLSEGFQDAEGKGYGLAHIEANHGKQIRDAGFASVKDFVAFVAQNYDEDNIRVGKRRENGNTTYLLQVQDEHDNTLFVEMSRDGSYWNINSAGVFRKGYSNKKETVTKTEPQQPNNAVPTDSSLSVNGESGITSTEPNGESTVSTGKVSETSETAQENAGENNGSTESGNDGTTEAEFAGNLFDEVNAAIAKAEADVDTSPTDAQKEAGNYRKGHVRIDGYDITIENPKGSERSGTDAKGNRWTSKMNNTYGYIRGTEGVDGDHIDVFLSDDPTTGDVFVVDQVNPENGEFDEHKVMYGFPDMESARKAYLSNYSKGWKGLGNITPVSKEEFKKWIESSHRKTKPFAEYSSVKPLGEAAESGNHGSTESQAEVGSKTDEDIVKLSDEVKDAMREYSQDMSTEKYVAWKEKESRLLAALGRLTDEELDGYAQSDNGTLRDAARKEQGRRMTIRNIDTMFNDGIKAQGDISVESKPGRFNVDVFASKDEKRESMNGVYHDESGYGVASDGLVLIYDKNLYDKNNKGKSVATHKIKGRYEKGDVLQEDRYPAWRKVIPHYGRKARVDMKGLRDFLAGVAEKQKERWNAYKADGDKSSMKNYTEQNKVILRMPDGSYIGMRVNALNALVSGATEMGLDELQWEGTDMSRALYFEGERGGVMAMPVNITDGVELSEDGRGLYYYDMSAGTSTGDKKKPVDSGMQPSSKAAADKGGEPLIKGDKWERTPAPERNTVKGKRGKPRYDVTYTIGEGKTKYGMTKADSDMLHYILEDYNDDLRAIWNTYERGGILLPEEVASAVKAMIEYELQSGKSAGVNSKTWRQMVDGGTTRVSEQEAELRDAVIGLLREGGLDVITDTETGQRVLDMANGQARLMGNRGTKKSASETAETLASSEELAYTTDISSADGAKLLKDIDNLAKSYEEKSNKPRTFLDDLAIAIGAKEEGTKSKYVTIKAKNGRVFTIRLANHNTTVSQFDHKGEAEGVSIVISGTVNKGIENDGKAHIVEFFYPERSLRRAEGKPLADIVRSIEQSLYSGEYKDTTGLAQRQEVNAEQIRLHKVYHGSGANFDAFDSSHMGEGEGAQSYGWGTYVTEVEGIGKTYAEAAGRKPVGSRRVLYKGEDAGSYSDESWPQVKKEVFSDLVGNMVDMGKSARVSKSMLRDLLVSNINSGVKGQRSFTEKADAYRNLISILEGMTDKAYAERKQKEEWSDLNKDASIAASFIDKGLGRPGAILSVEEWLESAIRNKKLFERQEQRNRKRLKYLEEFDENDFTREFPISTLYTVEIPDPREADYLDYTERMGGQHDMLDKVDSALTADGWHRQEIDTRTRFTKNGRFIILTPNQSGADLYEELSSGLGSPRLASEWLHGKCGITGISYPAQYRSGGRDDNARNYVVFDDGDLRITDKVRFFRTSDGEAYGFTLGGKIYIDTRIATAETPIHEYSHLWAEALRKANPEAWERLKKEMLGEKDVADYVRRLYPDITDEDELAEEVFTHYSGRRGAERLRVEQQQEMERAQGVFGKAQVATVFGRLRDALRNFWNAARDLFAGKTDGIEKYSAEDFADMMMADLLGNTESGNHGSMESQDEAGFRSLLSSSERKKSKEPVGLESIGLRKLKKGETCLVERKYVETGMFDFTGSEKIESSDDVAYIFRQLENAAVENSFVCLVKNGKPTVIHVGIGNYSGTMANIEQAFVAYKALKPEKVYFIHNHPGGTLKASRLDAGVLKSLYDIFGEKVAQPGIIIDTVSGKYCTYDRNATSGTMPMPEKAEAEIPVKVYSFGRQVFAPEWNPESAFTIDSSLSVAAFVSSHRLGEHEKMSFIVLNTQGHVTGNFFLPYTRMDEKNWVKMAEMMSEYVHQAGGVRGILYGNYGYNDADRTLLSRLSERMKQLKTPLLDVIHIDRSARDWGLVSEPQSGERTDRQGNPVDADGKLITEKVSSVDDITDGDFTHPTRSIELPKIPDRVDKAIGAKGKPVVIKKNIFEKNANDHQDLTPEQSREILSSALYNPDLYGQNKKASQPYRWVVINTKDAEGKNRLVLLEVNETKDNVEVVHWHYLDNRGVEKIKRQAAREDGQLLILPSDNTEEVGALSDPTQGLSSADKVSETSASEQEYGEKNERENRKWFGKKVSVDDYFESTDATFQAITDELDLPADVNATWERLMSEHPEWERHKSPKSESEYLIDRESGDIYRKSHHWGRVASCNWKIALVNQGAYAVGKANVRDFKRKQSYLDLAERSKQYEQRQYIRTVNRKFNEDLEKLTEENADRTILQLGLPSPILQSASIPNKSLRLYGNKALKKSQKHGFEIKDLRDLPKALEKPVAVFKGNHADSFAVLTTLKLNGKNTLVSIETNKQGEIDFNIVSSVYGKAGKGVVKWINDGKLLYTDKKQTLAFISPSAPIADATQKQELDSAAKVIKDFKNPNIAGENNLTGTTVEDAKERRAEELAEKLGVKVRIVKDTEELTDSDGALQRRKRKSKGWYSPRSGEIVIVLPNNRDVADVEATMLHEVVAHKGLRDLLGKDFDTFLDNVYNNVTEDIRRKIADLAIRKYGYDLRVATEEYLASLAEDTDFENIRKEGWWQTVKDLFMDLLRKAGIRLSKPMGDNELRYILWRSYNRLENRGVFGEAEGIVMENRLMERSGEEEETEKLSVAQAKSHLEQMRKKYKHLDNIEIVDGAKMTPEELASIFDYQIIDDAERKEIKDYLSDEHSLGNYDKITGKIVIFANKHSNLHELEGTVFHEGFHRYSNEIDNKLADFFWANKENFPNTMKRLELLGYTKDEYAEELGAFRIEAMLNDAKWKTADEIFQGDNKKLIENYLDYIGYDRAGEEEIRRKWIDGTRDRRNRERVRGRVIQGISRDSAKNGTPRESKQDVKKLQIGSTETSENIAEENAILFRDDDISERDRSIARGAYERMVASGRYQFQEAVQDSMLGLKALYKSVLEGERGGAVKKGAFRIDDVADYENAYVNENLMASHNYAEQHEYYNRYMKPLLKAIYKITGDNKNKRLELDDYLLAKHGLERNAKFADRDAKAAVEKDGSLDYDAEYKKNRRRDYAGLTALVEEWEQGTNKRIGVSYAEQRALEYVDAYEREHDTEELWRCIKRATGASLAKIHEGGLMSDETYANVRDMFDYYIPLQGWNEKTSDEVYGYLTGKDSPLMGSPIKHAAGRRSKADDPIATIAMSADTAIQKTNRNIMKQRFLNFVMNHPSDLVSLSRMWLRYNDVTEEWELADYPDVTDAESPEEVEQKMTAFEERMAKLAKEEPKRYKMGSDAINIPYKVVKGNLKEHQILVKRGGETFVLTINGNPRAAQALNGLTNPDVEGVGAVSQLLKAGESINRALSAVYTTRNPGFVVSNFLRDALYANCMTWVKEGKNYALRFHKNFGKVNPAVMRHLFGKWEKGTLDDSNTLEHQFRLFMINGGETGYTSVMDLEGHKKKISDEMKVLNSGLRETMHNLENQLDMLNRSVENCARFAAFLTSREMGRSVERSVYDAKEVSVNFNKKGAADKMLHAKGQTFIGQLGAFGTGLTRSLYVFWNAGVQGMTNFGRAAQRHPKRAFAGAAILFILGYVIPLLDGLRDLVQTLAGTVAAERNERIAGDLNITTTINDTVNGHRHYISLSQDGAEDAERQRRRVQYPPVFWPVRHGLQGTAQEKSA